MLLFREASVEQAWIMFEILQTFYRESGQKVNDTKSRVWYSPKTLLSVISAITNEFGVPSTPELGTYLGVPLVHRRVRQHFQYIVDKVNGKLSGWKRCLISQAARLILIQSISNTIPSYVMNTCKLPHKIVGALEQANRRLMGWLWRQEISTSCGLEDCLPTKRKRRARAEIIANGESGIVGKIGMAFPQDPWQPLVEGTES